jgi:hypothetical protein
MSDWPMLTCFGLVLCGQIIGLVDWKKLNPLGRPVSTLNVVGFAISAIGFAGATYLMWLMR